MDFERISGRELDQQASGETTQVVAPEQAQAQALAALQDAAMAGGALRVSPGADGVVTLPEGVSLDQIRVSGRDLIVQLPDGATMVIVDGAVFVPQIVIGDVEIPPLNLAALLIGNEPQPAAGPPQSSGGNFADPVGPIGDPFALGDLLPPTELTFPAPEEDELLPAQPDREPTISIVTPDNAAGAQAASSSVNEAGLPARGSEPAGSNASATSETTTGSILFTAPDGLASVAIDGTAITAVGQTIVGPLGTLTITAIAEGRIDYRYTLTDNTLGADPADVFVVTVTDSDGDVATGTLTINVIDDAPTARADTDAVAAGSYGPETGNVFMGTGTTSGAAGADTPGADGAAVTGVRLGAEGGFTSVTAGGITINGQYGTLTLSADGSYSYVRNPGTPGGVSDVFTYRITDGDGDLSTTTLTIAIGDSGVSVRVPSTSENTNVSEAGLPARGGEPEGSAAATSAETTSGSIAITAADGPAAVTINGTAVTAPGQTITTATGVLTITSISPTAIGYSYTLTDNTSGDATSDTLTIVVTDADGDQATAPLVITITDDAPTAADDADSVTEDGPTVADGNVLTGSGGSDANASDGIADVQGADGAVVTTTGSFAGQYGTLVLNADGSYTYTLSGESQPVQGLSAGETLTESFDYTIADGDGDVSNATLVITINGADDGVVISGLGVEGGEVVVNEDDLADGSSPDAAALTQDGSFAVDTPDGLDDVTIGGVQVIANGVFTAQTITSPLGQLAITAFTAVTGADGSIIGGSFSYSYTLTDNTLTHANPGEDSVSDSFAVTVTDSDGSTANASLDVRIIDDVPTAADDTDSVTEDGPTVADGNVLTGSGGSDANASDGIADVQGADGAVVTTTGSFAGQYGTLVLNADGSYSYTLSGESQPVQGLSAGETLTESFDYTIEDGDGDSSSATLVITINGADDGVVINGLGVEGGEEVVNEDDLEDGSSPDDAALTQGGSFTIDTPDGLDDVTIGGAAVVANGVFTAKTVTTAIGTLSITAFTPVTGADGSVIGGSFTYSYTLVHNTHGHTLPGEDSVLDSFAVIVTDSDGSTANASLDVRVIDDVPTAIADTNHVGEGGLLTIEAGSGVVENDLSGADGYPAGGAVVGVRAAGGDATTPVATGVGSAITGLYGTLTLQADGSYVYDAAPDVVPAGGATETFVYTLRDGDGDISTTTLTISLTDSGLAAKGDDVTVNEAALSVGSDPSSAAETVTGTLADNMTGGTGPFSFALVGAGTGNFGTLTLNPDGSYSYTLATPIDGATANNGTNTVDNAETFTFQATDANGNTVTSTITIDVIDDVPTARNEAPVSIAEDVGGFIGGNVLANDTQGADTATLTSVTIGGVTTAIAPAGTTNVATANGSYSFQANGAWTFDPNPGLNNAAGIDASFSYVITDGDGDLASATQPITVIDGEGPSAGAPIALLLDDQNLGDGSTPAGPDSVSASIAFTPGSDAIASIAFGADLSGLGGSLVWTRVSDTQIVGKDGATTIVTLDLVRVGDTAQVTATLNDNYDSHPGINLDDIFALGSVGVVATDIDGDSATGTVSVSVSDDLPVISATGAAPRLIVDETGLGTDASASFAVSFASSFGADGAGTLGYALGINAGSTGLVDTATGEAVVLSLESGQVVGRAGAGGAIVFTVSVDASGTVTLDQQRAIVHGNASNPDDRVTLDATNLITLTATVADGDGDSASSTINIGQKFLFEDDGPAIDASVTDGDAVLLTTQDAETIGAASDTAVSTANFGGAFSVASADFGADGAGTIAWSYALGLTGGPASGLASNGAAINLFVIGGQVIGSTAADAGTITAGNTIFTLDVNASTGVATLTQFAEIDHAPNGDASAPYDDQFAVLSTGLVRLTGTATITDGDGDTASETVTLDLGGNVRFADDGPSVSVTGSAPLLAVDETGLGTDASASFAVSFASSFGADGAGTISYALGIDAGTTGLVDTATGQAVVLSLESGQVVGRAGAGGAIVFIASVDAAGTVTLDQQRAVVHGDPNDVDERIALLTANLITLTATVTDGDGDSASSTITIGKRFAFDDDAPTARADADSVTEDGPLIADGNVLTGSGGGDANVTDGVADTLGADGGSVTGIAFGVTTGTMGSPLAGAYGSLTLGADGSYSYALNNALAAVQALNAGDTLTETFTYTVTDGDGDTATATLTITINGTNDGPTVGTGSAAVSEEGLAGGIADGTGNPSDTTNSPSANGTIAVSDPDGDPLTVTLGDPGAVLTVGGVPVTWTGVGTGVLVGSVGGNPVITITIDDAGAFTVTLSDAVDHATINAEDLKTFVVPVSVSDGTATTPTTLTVTIEDDSPTITGSAALPSLTVDETALATDASASFAGVFTSAFGADGAGTISYALGINAGATGLTDIGSGLQVVLSLEAGQVVGRAGAGGAVVFTVSVNGAGVVTLDQQRPVAHPNAANPDDAETLDAANLVTLTATVTDADGDAASATLDIGTSLVFEDDGPAIDASVTDGNSVLLTTQDAETIGAASDTAVSTANFGGAFSVASVNFGADGAGTTAWSFALSLTGGPASGLASNGAAINLFLIAGQVVGSTAANAAAVNAANTIFTLATDAATGAITLTQFAEIDHAPNGDTSAPYDDQFAVLGTGLVRLAGTATITDRDGDTASETVTLDLGGNVRFADDGPSIAAAGTIATLTVDETNLAANAIAGTSSLFTSSFGADGPGAITYALGFNPGATGLVDTATGQAVVLSLESGQVVGRAGAGGAIVFTVSVNAAGDVTLDQQRAIAHDVDGPPGPAHDDPDTLSSADLVTLTATITDGDGDSASSTINLGNKLVFEDDGPIAVGESAQTTEAVGDFNVGFVLDFSGSISNPELNTMLTAVKAAALELFNGTSGDVTIRTVAFSSTATSYGPFTSYAAFAAHIDSLNPATGGTRPFSGGTDFTAGIEELLDVYAADPTANNQVFFLSDGNPNEQLGPGGTSLETATADAWNAFVDANGVNVSTIGVGDGINSARLQDVDVDGAGAPILVADFDDLIDALLSLIQAGAVSGNVLANDVFGADGAGRILSITIDSVTYSWNGAGTIAVSSGGTIAGNSLSVDTVLGGHLNFNFATGAWDYAPPSDIPATTNETFTYTIVDGDGDTSPATLTVTVTNDNEPTTTPVSATLDDEALAGGITGGTGDFAGVGNEAVVSGLLGINYGPDGVGTVSFAGMQGVTASVGTETVVYGWDAATKTLTATIDGGTRDGIALFKVQITNTTTGAYTVTLLDNVLHTAGGNENDAGPVVLTYKAGDANGTTTPGTLSLTFDDDTPVTFTPQSASLLNSVGAAVTRNLDVDANINNNVGADQNGAIRFANIVNGQDTALKSGGVMIELWLSNNGQTLQGRTGSTNGTDGTLVYTVQLNQAAGTYTVTMAKPIDNGSGVVFGDLSGGDAGNPPFKIVESTSADNLELLFTPINGGSVNSDSNDVGIDGQFIDIASPDKGLRIDFGAFTFDPNGGGSADDRFVINGHSTVNGFSFKIDQISSGSTADVTLRAFNADEDGGAEQLTPNSAGDVAVAITMVKIFNAAGTLVHSATSDQDFGAIEVDFSSGVVTIIDLPSGYSVQTYTASGYDRIEITNSGSSSGTDGKFSISTLKVETTITGSPVNLGFDLALTDADGDTVTVANAIAITASPSAPPVVLDLDGDGVEFVDRSAGATFDYDGDGVRESTAWAGSDDGILARDANGDGVIDDAAEIVFGGNGLTDLQGLAANYDSNGDGVLDANDADFAQFGVWQDANGNGVSEAGEFVSLTDLGIASLALSSDGISYTAANDDVVVHGETVFTRTDGSTGTAADASFATGARTDEASRQAASGSSGLASALVAASLVAAPLVAPAEDKAGAPAGGDIAASDAQGDLAPANDGAKIAPKGEAIEPLTSDDHDAASSQASHLERAHEDAGDRPGHDARMADDNGASEHLVTPLLADADVAVANDAPHAASMFVDMTAMPAIPVEMAAMQVDAPAAPQAEALASVLADALGGGAGAGPDIDALLAAATGHGGDPAGLLAAMGGSEAAVLGAGMMAGHGVDLAMLAHDAVLAVSHA